MNQNLQNILDVIQQNGKFSDDEKNSLLKAVRDADKELEITAFKLERTEKVKKTTSILLEETIEELEQKRKAVEAQNRDLEIESALEKVRSSALAMKEPENMVDVCREISDQMQLLGVDEIRNVQTVIINERKGTYLNYQYFSAYDKSVIEETEYNEHPTVFEMVKEMKKSVNSTFSGSFMGEELNRFRKWRKQANQFPDPILDKADSVHYYFYSIGHGGLGLSIYKPLNDSGLAIFKRFHNVFTLAYRRFIDLEKAVAQAKEAQIELALERVRARTMAMQKSDELSETARVLFKQFNELGENPDQLSIGIINESEKVIELWLSVQGNLMNKMFKVPVEEPIVIHKLYTAWKEKRKSEIVDISGDELVRYNNFRNNDAEFIKYYDVKNNTISEEHRHVIYAAFFSKGLLSFAAREPRPEETIKIFERFAAVFDGTYTRFLDLQKAEEQAREAQIELSLERIRAQVTAMRESSELLDIVVTMRSEFVALGHEAHYFWHMRYLPDKYEKAMTSGDGTRIGMVMTLPRHIHGDIKLVADWEKSNEPTIVFAMDVETAVDYVDKMITLGDFKQVDPQAPTLDDIRHIGGLTFIMARTTHGEIGFSLPGTVPDPPKESLETLVRFASVFDLAYKRFEDLKNAERQQREAQIELALERVRARTMAMQHSDELIEASRLLDQQVRSLGIKTWGCAFNIYGENESTEWFSSDSGIPQEYKVPRENIFLRYYEAGQRGETLYIEEFADEDCVAHYEYLCSIPRVGDALKKVNESGGIFPTHQIDHAVYFKYGYLLFITLEPVPEAHDIFKRFAKVFEQTYTRFLDVKNAEAQNNIIQADNDRKTKELEDARQLQLSMLPKELPQSPNLDIAVYMRTATEVGGDYYDFSVKEDGSLNIALGDATGHGLKAGILVSAMKSIFTTNSCKMEIEDFFLTANSGIKSMNLKRMMVGFTMLNIKDNRFTLINAGMPPVFFYRHKTRTVEELKEHSVPIGAMNHNQFKSVNGSLEKGDLLLLLTDGLPELQNERMELYGYDRVRNMFGEVAQKNSQDIIDQLKNDGSAWINDQDPKDDVTFVVIKVK